MLVGASSAGKSTFARTHFLPTEVVSSDRCRAILSDDETDQTVTRDAFELLHTIVEKRLKLRRLTVVDATNVQPASRRKLIAIARAHNVDSVAIVFDLPEDVVMKRHAARTDRDFPVHVIGRQRLELSRSFHGLQDEGIRFVHVFAQASDVDAVTVGRARPLQEEAHHGRGA
ncbi:hypothetical protein GCM10027419_29430 [Pandoraea terrae]